MEKSIRESPERSVRETDSVDHQAEVLKLFPRAEMTAWTENRSYPKTGFHRFLRIDLGSARTAPAAEHVGIRYRVMIGRPLLSVNFVPDYKWYVETEEMAWEQAFIYCQYYILAALER